jgi:hypothetical protein
MLCEETNGWAKQLHNPLSRRSPERRREEISLGITGGSRAICSLGGGISCGRSLAVIFVLEIFLDRPQ